MRALSLLKRPLLPAADNTGWELQPTGSLQARLRKGGDRHVGKEVSMLQCFNWQLIQGACTISIRAYDLY